MQYHHFHPLPDDTLESALEPLDGLVTLDLVRRSDVSLAAATLGNTLTRTGPTIVNAIPIPMYA